MAQAAVARGHQPRYFPSGRFGLAQSPDGEEESSPLDEHEPRQVDAVVDRLLHDVEATIERVTAGVGGVMQYRCEPVVPLEH